MKFAFLALLAATAEGLIVCRNDAGCTSNWVKKKCCSHFNCNTYCNTKRCRVDTCGKTLCAKTAAEFVTRMVAGTPAIPAVPARLAVPPVPAVPALIDINGKPIPGTERPGLPGIPARLGRDGIPASGLINCDFPSDGIATKYDPANPPPTMELFEDDFDLDFDLDDEDWEDFI